MWMKRMLTARMPLSTSLKERNVLKEVLFQRVDLDSIYIIFARVIWTDNIQLDREGLDFFSFNITC